ncbi:MAG: hypothetical protein J5802_13440 [Butyrivibrio sp.]|nr:hypothetical protein [Butyrivibrio sp.]
MKKIFISAVALLIATLFVFLGTTVYATENDTTQEGLVIELPDAAIKVTVPDKYDYAIDQKQVYRGDLDKFGISASSQMQTLIDSNTQFEVLSITDPRITEAYLVCDTQEKADIANLNTFSETELTMFVFQLVASAKEEGGKTNTTVTSDSYYKDKNGIAYACMELTTKEDDGTESGTYCMVTFVDSKGYYYYVTSNDPSQKAHDYKEDALELIEGITYDNAPSLSSFDHKDAEKSDDTNRITLTPNQDYEKTLKENGIYMPQKTYKEPETDRSSRFTTRLITRICIGLLFGLISIIKASAKK